MSPRVAYPEDSKLILKQMNRILDQPKRRRNVTSVEKHLGKVLQAAEKNAKKIREKSNPICSATR